MSSIPHLYTAVEQLLTDSQLDLTQAARQRLVCFVIGVLVAGTLVLRRVATTQAHIALGSAKPASHERRLRRTLNEPSLGAPPMYGRVVRRVLRRLPATQRLWLIVDERGHSDVVRVLLTALWYRGRALPLTWVIWQAQQSHDQSYWTDCATLLRQVASILPKAQPITVLGDRAFGCPAFTDLVVAQGWDFIVRVQGQTRLQHPDGSTQALRLLLAQPGSHWCGRGQAFKKQGWRTVGVVGYWRVGCRDPLLLVTILAAGLDIVRQYRLRSAIEALFRDFKSSGWQWEASQVRDLEHQRVLVLVLALATLVTLCLGEEAAEQIVAQGVQRGKRRPWHARDSLFGLGRDRLWQRVWREDTSPIVWELSEFAAPNWSQECWQAARPSDEPIYLTERVGRRESRRKAA
jgi:hypothetical protein